jgi:hypothetical protein
MITGDVVSELEAADLVANADYIPEDVEGDFVVVIRTAYEPTMTLLGAVSPTKSVFSLLCKSDSKAGAATLAEAVRTAITNSTVITCKFFEPVNGDEFEPETMDNAEVVNVSIWH